MPQPDFFAKMRSKKHSKGQTPQKKSRTQFLKSARAEKVQTEELSPDDFIIAVMGPTGSGKSTFITAATGFDAGIGHDLQSCTSEINMVKLSFPGLSAFNLVFVDTPGFDDTNKSDSDILMMLSTWLTKTYKQDILLSGLLYLHRITDNRMAGTPLKNLRMFEGLCGRNMLQNVILTTTMWEEEHPDLGASREEDLVKNYWKAMIERGSVTRRFEKRTQADAFQVLEPLLDGAVRRHSVLIQREIVDMRLRLPETHAGQALFAQLEQLLERQQEILRRMRLEIQTEFEDSQTLATVKKEYEELKGDLDLVITELRGLKLQIGQRLLKTLASVFHIKRRRAEPN